MILIYYIQNLVSKAAHKDSDIAGMQNRVCNFMYREKW